MPTVQKDIKSSARLNHVAWFIDQKRAFLEESNAKFLQVSDNQFGKLAIRGNHCCSLIRLFQSLSK